MGINLPDRPCRTNIPCVPFPSLDLLAAAASELDGRHPLCVVTIPALVRAAAETGVSPTDLQTFGSKQERVVLDSFKVDDSRKPFLAVWKSPPQRLNDDYAGSTLQRLRTLDPLGRSILRDDYNPPAQRKRSKFALRPDAITALRNAEQPSVSRISLAAWLGRDRDFESVGAMIEWFNRTYPLVGTTLGSFYHTDIPGSIAAVAQPLTPEPVQDGALLDYFHVDAPSSTRDSPVPASVLAQAPSLIEEGLTWTKEVCEYPLPNPDPQAITQVVLADLAAKHVELPDAEQLVRRCVTALLVGHLILTGPPGTGKTTLGRALAKGFNSQLIEATATSEWSPYHVVGGFRPNAEGGLSPAYGKVVEAALLCAQLVRTAANAEAEGDGKSADQAHAPDRTVPGPTREAAWLFIDEFNRADIDKAIGSLYTLLSSCDPEHLRDSPVDLWFETQPDSRNLWVPARFRIIGAMNDLDTSFVNRISQGLTRRFQFITVGVPRIVGTPDQTVTSELEHAFAGAHSWLDRTYGSSITVNPLDQVRSSVSGQLEKLQQVIDSLRHPASASPWPIGTAQVVGILRVLLLTLSADPSEAADRALDLAIADLIVPQMAGVDEDQEAAFRSTLDRLDLPAAKAALEHVVNPHGLA